VSDTAIASLLEHIEKRQADMEQALRYVVDMLVIHNEKLDAILKAATHDPGPSPVVEALNGIVASLETQSGLLRELPESLAVTIRDELQRELEAEDIEMEEAIPGAFDQPDEAAGR
jgi:hypothetical protein